MSGLEIADIKREAQARILDILAALGVREAPSHGGYISMRNPMRKDRHPSFTIWTQGAAIGAFKDHADDVPGGTRGDIIDLVSYLSGWFHLPKKGRREALRWLTDYLGLERVDRARLEHDRTLARAQHLRAVKAREEDQARAGDRAFALWMTGKPILGTRVDTYLTGRGIDLQAFPLGPRGGLRLPHVLRALEAHEHVDQHGECSSLPCMIAGCVDYRGGEHSIRAVHRTWLTHNGTSKADVVPNRKVWPSFSGLVIPLWKGESNLSINEAIANGRRETVVLTEGIEDGLSAALAAPQFRTWAFIALGNLANVRLPACIDSVIVHRQNEWANGQAVRAFERGLAELKAQGRPVVEVAAMGGGKDLNDTLRGAA